MVYLSLGNIEIKEDNVETLLATSSMLQIHSIQDSCCSFLIKQLHLSNCLGIKSFASTYGCDVLYKASNQFVMVSS